MKSKSVPRISSKSLRCRKSNNAYKTTQITLPNNTTSKTLHHTHDIICPTHTIPFPKKTPRLIFSHPASKSQDAALELKTEDEKQAAESRAGVNDDRISAPQVVETGKAMTRSRNGYLAMSILSFIYVCACDRAEWFLAHGILDSVAPTLDHSCLTCSGSDCFICQEKQQREAAKETENEKGEKK